MLTEMELKELKERLMEEVNLTDFFLCEEGFILTEENGGWITDCPLCGEEAGLEIRFHKGYWLWKCVSQRKVGTIVDWIMKEHGLTEEEAVEKLAKKYFPEGKVEEEAEEKNPEVLVGNNLQVSRIWKPTDKKIMPEEIAGLIEIHGGEMLQGEIMVHYASPLIYVSRVTVSKALGEAEKAGLIKSETILGRGSPKLWKLIKQGKA
jgi:molybdopterin converting factor small subunit